MIVNERSHTMRGISMNTIVSILEKTDISMSKLSSTLSSVCRQAEKVPGPGKYLAHEDWKEGKAVNYTMIYHTII